MRYAWILVGVMTVAACQSTGNQYGLTGEDQRDSAYTNPRTYNTDDNPSWDTSKDMSKDMRSQDSCMPEEMPK